MALREELRPASPARRPRPVLQRQPQVGTPISTRERGAARSTVRSVCFQNASEATGPGSLRGPCSIPGQHQQPGRAREGAQVVGARAQRALRAHGRHRDDDLRPRPELDAQLVHEGRVRRRAPPAGRSRQSSTTPRAPSARSATLRRTASRRRRGPLASSSPARCSGSASTGTSRAPRAPRRGREACPRRCSRSGRRAAARARRATAARSRRDAPRASRARPSTDAWPSARARSAGPRAGAAGARRTCRPRRRRP